MDFKVRRRVCVSLEVTVTSLHPPRLCRIAVILSKTHRSLFTAETNIVSDRTRMETHPRFYQLIASAIDLPGSLVASSSPPQGFQWAHRAQIGRVGGARWGWLL